MGSKAKLYVVSTPIGNLNEMTPRAIEVLKSVFLIGCEDTRVTMKLCQHFEIDKPLVSCHEHNEHLVVDKFLSALDEGHDVAIVSDAGYPGISDPGSFIIQKTIDAGYDINVISGPCAIINALVGSGLDTTHFYFHGFLSVKTSDCKKDLELLKEKHETIIFYEAPHRITDTLEVIKDVFGNRKAVICRELTKIHEEFVRGQISDLIEQSNARVLKGEMVLVVEGAPKQERPTLTSYEIIENVNRLIDGGMSTKDAIKSVAEQFDIGKNEVYRIFHQ